MRAESAEKSYVVWNSCTVCVPVSLIVVSWMSSSV